MKNSHSIHRRRPLKTRLGLMLFTSRIDAALQSGLPENIFTGSDAPLFKSFAAYLAH